MYKVGDIVKFRPRFSPKTVRTGMIIRMSNGTYTIMQLDGLSAEQTSYRNILSLDVISKLKYIKKCYKKEKK